MPTFNLIVRPSSGGKQRYECTETPWDLGMRHGYGNTIDEAVEDFFQSLFMEIPENVHVEVSEEIKYLTA